MISHLTKTDRRFHSLSRRFVLQFCLFTLVICTVYGGISLVLMYTLEDRFIEKDILKEATYLSDAYQKTGTWPAPRSTNMQLHFSRSTFPEDFRAIAIEEPQRKEFFGLQGRHYHLHRFPDYPDVFLIAEVSEDLLVRPRRGGVIQFLIVSALLATTIACLIAWRLSRRTVRPLRQLAQWVDGVAPEHLPDNLSRHFPDNEVGILAQALEQALQRISRALEREKHFTRDVSHELRTPLAVIKNAIELNRSQETKNHNTEAVLGRIYHAAEEMEKNLHTLLMVAREEHTAEQQRDIALLPIIEKSILDNRHLLAGKQHIDIDITDRCNTNIKADPQMLKVLLDNILSNAFKYTESGTVHIDVADNSLVIQDSGPGIDPAISARVTESGVKGEHSTGFGFGLSIVKRLCEHQGWEMTVKSANGTTVAVYFGL